MSVPAQGSCAERCTCVEVVLGVVWGPNQLKADGMLAFLANGAVDICHPRSPTAFPTISDANHTCIFLPLGRKGVVILTIDFIQLSEIVLK